MPDMYLCLSDLLDQDLSAYEYFHSLPQDIRGALLEREIGSFEELQGYAARLKAAPPALRENRLQGDYHG